MTTLYQTFSKISSSSTDIPAPNQYVTTISLDHMLFLKPGSSPGFLNNYYEPAPSPDPMDFFGPFGDNTLTTINLDNKGSWTSGKF